MQLLRGRNPALRQRVAGLHRVLRTKRRSTQAPQSSGSSLADTNASLNAARDAYRQALRAQLEASALGQSLDPGNPDGSMALRNANHQLELASARYEEALREFIANTSVRRRSG
jgi:hypothetical protein